MDYFVYLLNNPFFYFMGKKLTKEEFIERARNIHGDKFDYSKVEYVNTHTKVCIICPIHGEFYQEPAMHLLGNSCPKCSCEYVHKNQMKSQEDFIKKCIKIYGNKYDYTKTIYNGALKKITVICPTHGEFKITANDFINGHSCPKCSKVYKPTTEEWIEKARKVHGDKYDYSKVEYVNNKTKVCIICPIHGEFWQKPNNHLQGDKCPYCFKSVKKTTDQFIQEAKKVHGDKYDYSNVEYIGNKNLVEIICPEHGVFKQTPLYHLQDHGCLKCNQSHLEKDVENILKQHNIKYISQYTVDWLGKQSLDFYLTDYNIAIECQGLQHFKVIDHFGGEEGFNYRLDLDKKKNKLCNENNVKIYYVIESKDNVDIYDKMFDLIYRYDNTILIDNFNQFICNI